MWPAWTALLGVLLGAAAGGLLIWLRQTEPDQQRLAREMNYLAACVNDLTDVVEAITARLERRDRDPIHVTFAATTVPDSARARSTYDAVKR